MGENRTLTPPEIALRCNLKPGDLGSIVRLHGILYAQEYGYDHTFEAYVAAGVAEFALSFKPEKDRVWITEREGSMVGSIAIVGRSAGEAQLRWFLIHPDSRGLGLGRMLLKEALQFCKERKYQSIFLWTLDNLTTATHLYRSSGFKKTDEKVHPQWGKTVREERYDLKLES